ncbi:SusC/RagA family TonB-linked outer membrane protein [Flavobacterium caeni]|uniref:Iron complex outermembrane recepter protein n=1 Tax=Flavobacterium caeni TaxID=490189 RepID=A0A1G5GGY4_9FLAO|nr:SusC/RagA family TonB-linked outer membrane protein [Flavobacterium caeni]SCY50836.1 iron complex outermembrane recepter protein [Flavobacterium caeni]
MKTIYKKLLLLLLLLPFSALAQSTLKGTVVDGASKQPIPGVNVVIQGASGGTQTDFDGNFTLAGVKNGDTIVFSYLGYTNYSVAYSGQANLTVNLREEAAQLSEVVVQIGYGSVNKKDATGSVSLVTAKDFNKGAIVSVDQLLTGKAAGVRIVNGGGAPDATPEILIRGGASISASNRPLIVIDGVPISNDYPAGIANPFNLINPNDVESFSILKDASATAIYGVRASNGVIIITTKKGSSGEPQFNYSGSVTTGQVDEKIDLMSGTEYTQFIRQYFPERVGDLGIPDGSGIADDPTTSAIEGRTLYDVDWQDQIFRTSISTDHTFSARANLYKKIPFRFSLGYNNTQGLVKTSDYERFTYSLKMTPKLLNDHLKIDVNAKGSYSDKNAIDQDGAIYGALSMDPTKPVYGVPNSLFGNYYQSTTLNGGRNIIDGATNPLALLEQRSRPERVTRFIGNAEFDYKMHFLPDLRAVLNLGIDASQSRIHELYDMGAIATYRFNQANEPVLNPGVNYVENQANTNTTMDAYLVYAKDLNGFVNKFDLTGGYSYQNFVIDGNKQNFRYNESPGTGIREEIINPNNVNNRYYNILNLQAFFGRANIDFAGKYLLTASFRAEASSVFTGKDQQWGYFPSGAFAWKIKEESFMKDVNFVDDLKLRLSYGETGQASITGTVGYYPSRPLFLPGSPTSQYLPGSLTYSALAFNPDITWETSKTYNAGLDFSFFKNGRLSGSVDFYSRETEDLLARVPVPVGQYLTNEAIRNFGSTESKGFEVALNVKAFDAEKVQINVGGNIAYNYSEVTKLDGGVTAVQATESRIPTQTGLFLANHAVGYQPYSAWVFQQIYDAAGNPIPGAFADLNADGQITNDDKYYRSLRPNWTYGFNLNINAYNFDFSAGFHGQIDGMAYNSSVIKYGFTERATQGTTNALNNVMDFNQGAADPTFANFNGNSAFSDYLLEEAWFLRCDNITLGYKFPKFVKNTSLRIYGSINNAFIITDYSGQDPENYNAIDNNFYPRPRMYTFGLSFDF